MFPQNATGNATANAFNFGTLKALGLNTYGDDLYVNPTPIAGFENLTPNGDTISLDNGQYGMSLKLRSGAEVMYAPVHKSIETPANVSAWKLVTFEAARDYKGYNVQNPDTTGRPVAIDKYVQAVHGTVLSEVNVVAGQKKVYAVAA